MQSPMHVHTGHMNETLLLQINASGFTHYCSHVHLVKTQNSLSICPVRSVFSELLGAKPIHAACSKNWPDYAAVHGDLCLHWACHKTHFLTSMATLIQTNIVLDNRPIRKIFFSYFSAETHVVGTHLEGLNVFLYRKKMSTTLVQKRCLILHYSWSYA